MSKKLSFLIPSRNDNHGIGPQSRLLSTINCIISQILKFKLEDSCNIILIDYGSTDKLDSLVFKNIENKYHNFINYLYCPGLSDSIDIDYFPEPWIINYAIAKNRPIDYFCKVDQDTIPGPNFFKFFKDSKSLPDVGYSGCRSIPIGYKNFQDKIFKDERLHEFWLLEPEHCYNHVKLDMIYPFVHTNKGVLFFSSESFHKVSGFNENMYKTKYINFNFIGKCTLYFPIYNLGLKTNFDFYHQQHNMASVRSREQNSIIYANSIVF